MLQPPKEKRLYLYTATSELCNELLGMYFDEYSIFSDAKRIEIGIEYDPVNLMLDTYDYINWPEKEESDDKTIKSDEKENFADIRTRPLLAGDM